MNTYLFLCMCCGFNNSRSCLFVGKKVSNNLGSCPVINRSAEYKKTLAPCGNTYLYACESSKLLIPDIFFFFFTMMCIKHVHLKLESMACLKLEHLRTRFLFDTHIFDLCKMTWCILASSKRNFK